MTHLERLKKRYSDRDIRIYQGDFNESVEEILRPEGLSPTKATFCLIDQRTTECQWQTLDLLANYRTGPMKIELFYLLANSWMRRTLKSRKTERKLEETRAWWGGDGWPEWLQLSGPERAEAFAERFRAELHYRWVGLRVYLIWPPLSRQRFSSS